MKLLFPPSGKNIKDIRIIFSGSNRKKPFYRSIEISWQKRKDLLEQPFHIRF
jgi:hypothetical protein